VLVVVDVVPSVPMAAVDVVEMVAVRHGRVAASLGVDVHVAGVREMVAHEVGRAHVDVVLVHVVDVPVVEEVDVVVVGHRGVAAEPIVGVRVLLEGQPGRLAHRAAR
jgi:hypothetical protein